MGSTYERSLAKGFLWEGISFVLTLLAVYWFYGDFSLSLKFTLGLTLIKVLLFFLHERAWKKVKWGKLKE